MKELRFDKSAVRKEFTTLEFPTESVLGLWQKLDALNIAARIGGGMVERYELWKFVEPFFPEHDFTKGAWRINMPTYGRAVITNEPEPMPPSVGL